MFVPEQVAVYFDGHAQTWDEIAPGRGRIDCILDNIFLNAFLQKRYSPAGCSVLDVGCGTGVLFPYLKERGVTEITGIDLSGKMIEQAGKKAGSGR